MAFITKYDPFQVVYGRPPPQIIPYSSSTSKIEAIDVILKERDKVLTFFKGKSLLYAI